MGKQLDNISAGVSKNTDTITAELEGIGKELLNQINLPKGKNSSSNSEGLSVNTPKKTTKATKYTKSTKMVPNEMLRKLWTQIPGSNWVSFLNIIAPEYKWKMEGKSAISGLCPWHHEKTPSLRLSFTKSIGKCFGCDHTVSNMVQLVSKVTNTDFVSALTQIISHFHLEEMFSNLLVDELQDYYNLNEMKKEAAVAFNKALLIIRDNNGKAPSGLEYCQEAYDYITKVRKLNPEQFGSFQIGVLLKYKDAIPYISEKYHTLYEKYFREYDNNSYWVGALLFYYNDSPTTISRFRLRKPIVHIDSTKDIVVFKDPYAQSIGFYGMYSYRHIIGRDTDIYVTEGEFDVLSTLCKQADQGRLEFSVLCTGGSAVTDLSSLRDFGIDTIYLISDSPKKAGDSWLFKILKNQNNFIQTVGSKPINYFIYNWNSELLGDDLDEVMHSPDNDLTTIINNLYVHRNSHFLTILSYIKKKCGDEIDTINNSFILKENELNNNEYLNQEARNIELETLKQAKVRVLEETFVKWLAMLYSPADKKALLNFVNEKTEQDFSEIVTSTGAIQNYTTVPGIINALRSSFEETYSVSYYEMKPTTVELHVWNRRNHLDMSVNPTSSESICNLLNLGVGSINDWMERIFPDNPILNDGLDKQPPLTRHLTYKKNCQNVLKLMIESYLANIPEMSQLSHLGQGIHHMILPTQLREQNIIYFVNGAQIFKATFDNYGLIHWEELQKNTDENMLYFKRLTPLEKWSFVSSVEDFNHASRVDLKDLYFKILDILNNWKFRNHQVIAPYLAAYIMSVPLQTVIGNPSLMFITGDPESGKTTLIQNLLGGMKNTRAGDSITLVEMSNYVVEASSASLFQKLDKSSLLLCVDESEDTSAHNTKADEDKRELVRALYNMQTGGGKRERGTPDGNTTKTYHLFLPTILAGINPPRDNVFLSRVFMVHTKKEYGHKNVNDAILDKYSSDELESMRRAITVGLLPDILKLKLLRKTYRKELSTIAKQIGAVSERFIESIAVPLTILKYLDLGGKYPEKYAYLNDDIPEENLNADRLCLNIVSVYKNVLEAIHEQQGHTDLLNTCLYAPVIKSLMEDQGVDKVSARDLIVQNGDLDDMLNRNKMGIYIIRSERRIIFNWKIIKYGKLLDHTKYAYHEIAALVEMAKRNKFVDREVTPELMRKVRHVAGKELTARDITALDIAFLEEAENDPFFVTETELSKIPELDVNTMKDRDDLKHNNLSEEYNIPFSLNDKATHEDIEEILKSSELKLGEAMEEDIPSPEISNSKKTDNKLVKKNANPSEAKGLKLSINTKKR